MNPIERVNKPKKMTRYDSEYIIGSEDEADWFDSDDDEPVSAEDLAKKTKEQRKQEHEQKKQRLIQEAYEAEDWSVSTPKLKILLQEEERRYKEQEEQFASN
jgi:hypothetical protein